MHIKRVLFFGFAAVLTVVIGLHVDAREVVIQLKNGREVRGELLGQTGDVYRIRLENNREERIPRSQISRIDEQFSIEEQYEKWRDETDDDDLKGRMDIARRLYRIEDPRERAMALDLSLQELEDILKDDPNYEEAKTFRFAVRTAIKKLEEENESPTPNTPNSPDDPKAKQSPDEPRRLTQEEINTLKVYETNLSTEPVIVVPETVAKKILSDYRSDPIDPVMEQFLGRDGEARFRRLDGHQKLRVIFDLRARELYPEVIVRTEPATLRTFRTQVNSIILNNYCGKCHSGAKAEPGFRILRGPSNEETTYTNLMILASTKINGLSMINKDDPERSPLLQYALPREASTMPHREVRGWRPLFRSRNDRTYQAIFDWMRSLYDHPSDVLTDYQPYASEEEKEEKGGEIDAQKAAENN